MERLLGAFYNKKRWNGLEYRDKKVTFFKVCHVQGGWILATCPCVLAQVYTSDSLLIKDIKIYTVQTSNMQYAFEVKVYGEVLYLEFYSKPFILMKYWSVIAL